MSERILVVEDDATLRRVIADALVLESFAVESVVDGEGALAAIQRSEFDLVVLDLMLPGIDGFEVLRRLRAMRRSVAVILLTARGDENDRVQGLDLGADDYVAKPFSLRELMARVRAVLRRRSKTTPQPEDVDFVVFALGGLTVDLGAFEIRSRRGVLPLTPIEVAVLGLLRREEGRVVSRAAILRAAWPDGGGTVTMRSVDNHIMNLRKKLEVDSAHPRHLLTVHGAGYRLVLTNS